jgi:hypothetical protein
MDFSENVSISEVLDIQLGNFVLHLQDDPVKAIDTLSFNLEKGVLMDSYVKYYLDLLIMQYKNKPRAEQHLTTLIQVALIDLMSNILRDCFDIETAEGKQLDMIGKYVGADRRVQTFGADVTLSDNDYRNLIKIKRATNNLGSSLFDIQSFIKANLFGTLKAFDHADMTMSFYINSSIISNILAQAIITQGFLPKPMGVGNAAIVYLPDTSNIFGFRTYEFDSGGSVGFNNYSNYHPERRFLKYEDAIQ